MIYDYVVTKPPLNEDTLTHYGVKGMKWRKRKAKVKSFIDGLKPKTVTTITNATTGETRDVSNNKAYENLGKSVKKAQRKQKVKEILDKFKIKEEAYVTDSSGKKHNVTGNKMYEDLAKKAKKKK